MRSLSRIERIVFVSVALAALGTSTPLTKSTVVLAEVGNRAGNFMEGVELAKHALDVAERKYGLEHLTVAAWLGNLGEFYESQGRYREAEPIKQRTLAIREKLLGPHHPDVGQALSNLANLDSLLGRYTEAEVLGKRSLAIREKALGRDHLDVSQSLNSLAELSFLQARYPEAEAQGKRALAIRQKALGHDHPDVATSLHNLATLFHWQARYLDAESLCVRSLMIREAAFGPKHPLVGQSLNKLAELYHVQNRSVEAEKLYRRSLAIAEMALGHDHPDVATSLHNLATLYRNEGRYAEAEPLFIRDLAINERVRGLNHPDVGKSLSSLAELYRSQGRYEVAEPLSKRGLAIDVKALGVDHPQVGLASHNLASLYASQGRYEEAETLHKRSLAIRTKALGSSHPDVGQSSTSLANLYRLHGRHGEADVLLARASVIPSWEIADVPILFATNRQMGGTSQQREFGNDQIIDVARIGMGRATIRVPKIEAKNRADRAALAPNDLHKTTGRLTAERTLSLHRLEIVHDKGKKIFGDAHESLSRASRFPKQAIIFVHGYNTSFEEALRRAAMIAYDLDFDGLAAAFAWPSRSGVTGYLGDRDRAATAAPFLLRMLEAIAEALPDVKLHLLGHSTGAEVLLNALELYAKNSVSRTKLRLGEVILAHADVNRVRLTQVLGGLDQLNLRITSYSSNDDWAMWTSQIIRGDGGRVGAGPVHLGGVDAIDITGLGSRLSMNHNVFVQSPLVFGDMERLLATGERPPEKRTPYFAPVTQREGTHWEFRSP